MTEQASFPGVKWPLTAHEKKEIKSHLNKFLDPEADHTKAWRALDRYVFIDVHIIGHECKRAAAAYEAWRRKNNFWVDDEIIKKC